MFNKKTKSKTAPAPPDYTKRVTIEQINAEGEYLNSENKRITDRMVRLSNYIEKLYKD
jgi:hypothetical protein